MGEESKSFNSEQKNIIRENWNKPLLKFLQKKLNERLIYMGLPSSSAEDIQQWIDFIKSVIAFQCRVYKSASDASQSREEIEKLEEILRRLERERKLENFVVYDGYLEEVILRGFDNSPNEIVFSQNGLVTLYNLDFCNDIASPIEFVDKEGNFRTAYKFDAIKELLNIQKKICNVSDKFIFLLTVHCSYNGKELEQFLNNPPNEMIKEYLDKYHKLSGAERNARIVRLFFTYLIHQSFPHNGFTPQILPAIIYDGLMGTPLLHFVVLGTATQGNAGDTPIFQQFNEVINQKFIKITDEAFTNSDDQVAEESGVGIDPIALFTQSNTYKKLWV